jgi:hypothetical protein
MGLITSVNKDYPIYLFHLGIFDFRKFLSTNISVVSCFFVYMKYKIIYSKGKFNVEGGAEL